MHISALLLFITVGFASANAHASWAINCALDGHVMSKPKLQIGKPQKRQFVVFKFEVSKAEALEGNYVADDCSKRKGNIFTVELLDGPNLPKLAIGDALRIRYEYFEQECPGGRGGACSAEWYEYISTENAEQKPKR